jgi:acyl dehydratase
MAVLNHTSGRPDRSARKAREVVVGPVGKAYDGGVAEVRRGDFLAYAAATDDPNPRYAALGVAPPMFHVRPLMPLLHRMATDPELELDYLRLVHGEHAATFHRPLRDGDALALGATLTSLEDKPSGRVATFAIRGTVGGELALEGSTVFFIRREGGGGGGGKKAPPEDPGPPTWEADQPVAPDQAARYADASGDRNPIHLDAAVAQKAGLPGPILHGLCTMAFAQRDLIARACDGDPRRLRSIGVRWVKPVLLGEVLRMSAWASADGIAFATRNPAGQPVLTGRATVG